MAARPTGKPLITNNNHNIFNINIIFNVNSKIPADGRPTLTATAAHPSSQRVAAPAPSSWAGRTIHRTNRTTPLHPSPNPKSSQEPSESLFLRGSPARQYKYKPLTAHW
mmetsp:Transcript_21126/g.45803  ORF Transcript_21126/g.45803 Transcript_21126/m.45803 type:complete len:109 (+) Transcript_21126:786-1112(+)